MRRHYTIHDAAQTLIATLSSQEFALEVEVRVNAHRRTRIARKLVPLIPSLDYTDSVAAAMIAGQLIKSLLPPHTFPDGVAGVVYVLTDASGLFKIGRSIDVTRRLQALRWSNPTIRLVACVETNNTVELESMMHHMFAARRISGEWFDLDGA